MTKNLETGIMKLYIYKTIERQEFERNPANHKSIR